MHTVYRSHFHHFCPNQTLKLLDFVAWCASNYSPSERVLMESTRYMILFLINSLIIRYSLELPPSFTLKQEYFVEENLIVQFRHVVDEEKQIFYSKILKSDVFIVGQSFPLDVSLFNEESRLVISMLSQFLGMDTDRFVLELLLSLLFKMSMSQSES